MTAVKPLFLPWTDFNHIAKTVELVFSLDVTPT